MSQFRLVRYRGRWRIERKTFWPWRSWVTEWIPHYKEHQAHQRLTELVHEESNRRAAKHRQRGRKALPTIEKEWQP